MPAHIDILDTMYIVHYYTIVLLSAAGLGLAYKSRPRPRPTLMPTMTMKLALMASTMLTLMAEGLMLIPDAR